MLPLPCKQRICRRAQPAPAESRALRHMLAVEAILAHRDGTRVDPPEGVCIPCSKTL
jgi:hypothetical protein